MTVPAACYRHLALGNERFAARTTCHTIERIRPDQVQLNTAVRPPAEEYAMAVPPQRLRELARRFQPRAKVIAGSGDETH